MDANSTAPHFTVQQPPKLLEQLRQRIPVLHYSIRAKRAYVDWARRFIVFHGKRHPREMGAVEVTAFLTHLAVERHVSASTQNQAKAAILFLYKESPLIYSFPANTKPNTERLRTPLIPVFSPNSSFDIRATAKHRRKKQAQEDHPLLDDLAQQPDVSIVSTF